MKHWYYRQKWRNNTGMAIKKKFVWKLSYLVEVEAELKIEEPDFNEYRKRKPETQGKLKSLRHRKVEDSAELEKLTPTATLSFKVHITPKSNQRIGTPSTPTENRFYTLSGFSSEMSYIQEHFKTAVEEIVYKLRKESQAQVLEQYETKENKDGKIESVFEESEKTRKVSREERIKRINQQADSNMRRRINPLNQRRPNKSDNQRNKESEEGHKKLQKIFKKLINDNEKIKKSVVARLLRIGSEKNRTASMDNWLKNRDLDWDEELAKAKNQ